MSTATARDRLIETARELLRGRRRRRRVAPRRRPSRRTAEHQRRPVPLRRPDRPARRRARAPSPAGRGASDRAAGAAGGRPPSRRCRTLAEALVRPSAAMLEEPGGPPTCASSPSSSTSRRACSASATPASGDGPRSPSATCPTRPIRCTAASPRSSCCFQELGRRAKAATTARPASVRQQPHRPRVGPARRRGLRGHPPTPRGARRASLTRSRGHARSGAHPARGNAGMGVHSPAMSAKGTGGRFRDALRSRDFRLLTTSFVIDGLGSWAYVTVLIVYVFERTGSTTWIALLTASSWVPRLLLSSYGGVLADRFERTKVMIVSALLSAATMAVLAVVIAADGSTWADLGAVGAGRCREHRVPPRGRRVDARARPRAGPHRRQRPGLSDRERRGRDRPRRGRRHARHRRAHRRRGRQRVHLPARRLPRLADARQQPGGRPREGAERLRIVPRGPERPAS